jgi:hypothetical protein
MVAAAIESGRFYLTTGADAAALVEHRFNGIRAEVG